MKKETVTFTALQTQEGLFIDGQLISAVKTRKGIVSIHNGSAGVAHSVHPNINISGSVKGMKERGYWGKNDKTLQAHGRTYNISYIVLSDTLDKIAYMIQFHNRRDLLAPCKQLGVPETRTFEIER